MSDVSVIIATYKPSNFLNEAVASILTQSVPPDEIIIVDDGSGDEYQPLLREVIRTRPGIQLINLEENTGVANARNIGLGKANGRFVLFMDDDDKLASGMIEHSRKILEEHEEIDAVISQGEVFSDDDHTSFFKRQKAVFNYNQAKYSQRSFLDKHFFLVYSPMVHAVFCRKRIFRSIQFQEDLKYGKDRFLWLQLRQNGVKFATIDFTGGYYRLRGAPFGSKVQDQKYFFEKLLKSGLLKSRFEKGYVYSFLFLLSLKKLHLKDVFLYGIKMLLFPRILLSQVQKLLNARFQACVKVL